MSLINPETGKSLPNVKTQGKIDKIINLGDRFAIKEHKSTTSSLDSDSSYWGPHRQRSTSMRSGVCS